EGRAHLHEASLVTLESGAIEERHAGRTRYPDHGVAGNGLSALQDQPLVLRAGHAYLTAGLDTVRGGVALYSTRGRTRITGYDSGAALEECHGRAGKPEPVQAGAEGAGEHHPPRSRPRHAHPDARAR